MASILSQKWFLKKKKERLACLNNLRVLQLGTLAYLAVGLGFKPRPARCAACNFFCHRPFLPLGGFILHLPRHPMGRLGLNVVHFALRYRPCRTLNITVCLLR